MATMLQQWARQYHKLNQVPQHDPKTKARIHALYSRSTDKMFIQCLGFGLPSYLHLSVLLFFIGLFHFLRNFDDSILHAAIGFFGFCMVIYGFFTILPLFLRDSLLFTPFSAAFVSISALLVCTATTMSGHRFNARIFNFFESLFKFVEGTASELTSKHEVSKLELDIRILEKTLDSLGKDGAVEKFFEAIPDFFPSDACENNPITGPLANKFEKVMRGFLDRTFTGTTVTEEDKNTRLLVCLKASHAALGPEKRSWILSEILEGDWRERLQSVEMGHSLRSWSNGRDDQSFQYVRCVISSIIASAEKHDERWSALVVDELDISEDVLRDYLAQDDNILLANFNTITRLIFRSHLPCSSWKVSSLLSKCDISRALPCLQHDFCNLRDDIAQEAQKCNGSISGSILKDIRHVCIASQEDAIASPTAVTASTAGNLTILNQPSPYPSYNITGHRSHQMLNDYDDPADVVSPRLTTHSSTQAVPPRGDVSVGRTRPLITPAPRATPSPTHEPSAGAVPDAPQYATPIGITSSSLPILPASQPSPTLPPDVTAVGARQGSTDPSAISSAANLRPHSTSGSGGLGVTASQQNELVILPSVIYDSPYLHVLILVLSDNNSVMPPSFINCTLPRSDHPPHALGFLSPSMTASRPHNTQDPNTLSLAGDPH